MIAECNTDLVVTSTLGGDKIKMGIDPGALAHIVGILTDLYSNPRLAVIREYSTNGWDAHVEAGTARAIEVSLPGALSPYFRVQDFGVGMSAADIAAIYSQYGASTKRATNEQTGMLGLGCKSALTYTSQFTVVGVKDGRRVQVAVSRDDDGAGSMTVVSDEPTLAGNGVEIVVPVKTHDIQTFCREAHEFFAFWKAGTVLVNGSPPQPRDDLRLADDLFVIEGSQSYVVMGNVAYPAKKIETPLAYEYSVLAYVPIGAVNFTPSREALMYTSKTNATIEAIKARVKADLPAAIQAQIEAAPSHVDALRARQKWEKVTSRRPYSLPQHTLPQHTYSYKGLLLPNAYKAPSQAAHPVGFPGGASRFAVDTPIITLPASGRHILSRHNKVPHIDAKHIPDALWFHGYDTDKAFTANRRKKLNHWMHENTITLPSMRDVIVLLKAAPVNFPWIDDTRVFNWADVEAVKFARIPRVAGAAPSRIPGSFDCCIDGAPRGGYPANDIDQKLPVFYARGNRHLARRHSAALCIVHPKLTVVSVGANRIAKFIRDFPTAQDVSQATPAAFEVWKKALTPDQTAALAMQDAYKLETYKRLDPARISDPELVRVAELARAVKVDALLDQRQAFWSAGGRVYGSPPVKFSDPLGKYPLFDENFNDAGYLYLNLLYSHLTQPGAIS